MTTVYPYGLGGGQSSTTTNIPAPPLLTVRPGIGQTRSCPGCGRPQHYSGVELGWCHDALVDTWDCADPRKAGA